MPSKHGGGESGCEGTAACDEQGKRTGLHEHAGDDQRLAADVVGEPAGEELARRPRRPDRQPRRCRSGARSRRGRRGTGAPSPQASASFRLLTSPACEQARRVGWRSVACSNAAAKGTSDVGAVGALLACDVSLRYRAPKRIEITVPARRSRLPDSTRACAGRRWRRACRWQTPSRRRQGSRPLR